MEENLMKLNTYINAGSLDHLDKNALLAVFSNITDSDFEQKRYFDLYFYKGATEFLNDYSIEDLTVLGGYFKVTVYCDTVHVEERH